MSKRGGWPGIPATRETRATQRKPGEYGREDRGMTKRIRQLIEAHLLHDMHAERVRFRRDGGVDAIGIMPNTDKRGWWFAGWADELAALLPEAVQD